MYVIFILIAISTCLVQEGVVDENPIVARPDLYQPLTEPPCSYCVNQDRKRLLPPDEVVLAWVRGAHNGGAFPLRHFLAAPRVLNDTYGLFFYDADGGYVSAFEKDYGFSFYGWRGGVMVVKGPDGSLWSALTGIAIDGPKQGSRMKRVPGMVTTWGHWLMLHPESTAYDLFDGNKYPVADLPTDVSRDALANMGVVDSRLDRFAPVLGIEGDSSQLAFPLDGLAERAVETGEVDGRPVVVFWYGLTRSAIAFSPVVDGQTLTFYADEISPETAPFKDKETGTRWSLAGRGIDGPLRGRELDWAPSLQCRWFAWSHEYPQTAVHHATDTGR
jgi:hypothetical protein